MKYSIVVSRGRFASVEQAACAEREVDWWDDADPGAVPCTECWAAAELQKYLTALCGADARLVEAEEFDFTPPAADAIVVFIGTGESNPALCKMERLTALSLCADGRVKAEGYRLCGFAWGDGYGAALSGRDRAGTLYAAYAYLERHGIRFVSPGMQGTCRHASYNRSGERVFDEVGNPDFVTRGAMSSYVEDGSLDLVEWMSHNRFNYADIRIKNHHLLKKLGIQISGGGHEVFYRFMDVGQPYPYRHALCGGEGLPEDPYPVSPEYEGNGDGVLTYGGAHPEWYALVDGKRRRKRDYEAFETQGYSTGDNICASNPHGVAELVRLTVDDLIAGEWKYVDYLNFWPLDNGKWCECEACRSAGNYSYQMLMLAYALDRALKTAYTEGRLKRRVKIVVPVYHETLPAPDRPLPEDFDYDACFITFFPIERCFAHDFDDPVCAETNRFLYDRYLPWTGEAGGNYKGGIFIGEYYNVSSFSALPFVLTRRILHDIPFYYRTGTRHFHYMHITARSWGFSAINNYLYARLLWDVRADGQALCREYFDLRYGPLSDTLRRVYGELEAAGANCKYWKHYQVVGDRIQSLMRLLPTDAADLFPLRHMQYDGRADAPEAGPSLTETLAGFEAVSRALDAVLLREEAALPPYDARLAEDAGQMEYGLCMLRFLYAMTRYKMLLKTSETLAAGAFEKVRIHGELLRRLTAPLDGYDHTENHQNGLEASWLRKYYDALLEKYRPSPAPTAAEPPNAG